MTDTVSTFDIVARLIGSDHAFLEHRVLIAVRKPSPADAIRRLMDT